MISRSGIRKGIMTYWHEYFSFEMPSYWEKDDQGHQQAMARGDTCATVDCSIEDAKTLSALFVNEVFAIPTCTHYDGKNLSLYCGDAGSNRRGCLDAANRLIDWYFHQPGRTR